MKYQSVDEFYPEKWITSDDVERPVTLTVARVVFDEVHDVIRKEDKEVITLAFNGTSKRLILNKTQTQAMVDITGSKMFADWPGARVRLTRGIARNNKPTIVIRKAPPKKPAEAEAKRQAAPDVEKRAAKIAEGVERSNNAERPTGDQIIPEGVLMADSTEIFSKMAFNNRLIAQAFGKWERVEGFWEHLAGQWQHEAVGAVWAAAVAYAEALVKDGLSKKDSLEKAEAVFVAKVSGGAAGIGDGEEE